MLLLVLMSFKKNSNFGSVVHLQCTRHREEFGIDSWGHNTQDFDTRDQRLHPASDMLLALGS